MVAMAALLCHTKHHQGRGCYLWMSRSGRPVAPPPLAQDDQRPHLHYVHALLAPGDSLGLVIRGGAEYGVGVYVMQVDAGSLAETLGLQFGDQIYEVNGVSFLEIRHRAAVDVLAHAMDLSLLYKRVGKVPYTTSCQPGQQEEGESSLTRHASVPRLRAYVRQESSQSLQSAPSSYQPARYQEDHRVKHQSADNINLANSDTKVRSVRQQERLRATAMVREKAGALLSQEEFTNFKFYLSKYKHSHITIRELVSVLGKLFDCCHEKEGLFTELREIVHKKDLSEFDAMVYEEGKVYERVLLQLKQMQMSQLKHGDSVLSLQEELVVQGKISPSDRKFVRNKSLDKIRHLNRFSGSQPSLCPRMEGLGQYCHSPVLPSSPSSFSPLIPSSPSSFPLLLPSSPSSFPPLLPSYTSSQAKQLENQDIEEEEAKLLEEQHHNEDIEQEEEFLEAEMTTGWEQQLLLEPTTRSLSLASFQRSQEDVREERKEQEEGEGDLLDRAWENRLDEARSPQEEEWQEEEGSPKYCSHQEEDWQQTKEPEPERDDRGWEVVRIARTKSSLGLAFEGGENVTKLKLPRIINISSEGAAGQNPGIRVGQIIREVDGKSTEGLSHTEIGELLCMAYSSKGEQGPSLVLCLTDLPPSPTHICRSIMLEE